MIWALSTACLRSAADWQHCFYYAGCAKWLYAQAYRAMQEREHGKWVGYYANECQTDVRQSAQVCGYLMSFARTLGEGPHYYEWMREFGDPEEERGIMLILNTEPHPGDDRRARLADALDSTPAALYCCRPKVPA